MKRKIFLILTITFLGFLVTWSLANRHHVKNFLPIISSYYAKEYCSCYFVTKLKEDACHALVEQYIPIQDFKLNKDKKTVTVRGLWKSNTAEYNGAKVGCRLIN